MAIKKILPTLIVLFGVSFMGWGISNVNDHLVIPDGRISTYEALIRLAKGTPFRADFKKGGNLHPQLLSVLFLPEYYSLIPGDTSLNYEEKFEIISEQISEFYFLARFLSYASALAGLFLIILLGNYIFSHYVGILSGALMCLSLPYVHYAHLSTEDMVATTLLVCTYCWFGSYWLYKKRKYVYGAAITSGLAISAKATTGLILIPLAHLVLRGNNDRFKKNLRRGLKLIALVMLAYVLTSPSILVHSSELYTETFQEVSNRWGQDKAPVLPVPVIQFLNLGRAFGLPLFLISIVSLFDLTRRKYSPHEYNFLISVSLFCLPYSIIIGSWGKYGIVYLLPLIPFLCLVVSIGIDYRVQNGRFRKTYLSLFIICLLFSVLYTASAIYPFADDSRTKAADYLKKNLTKNSSIDAYTNPPYLPELPGYAQKNIYSFVSVADSPVQNVEEASQRVKNEKIDYIILVSSNYERFFQFKNAPPEIAHFYRRLIGGKTNYRKVKRFGPPAKLTYSIKNLLKLTVFPRALHPINPTILIYKSSRT